MILAAGRGERMRPLTDHTPKPLLEAGGKALIVRHLEKLAASGFSRIVVNHAHLGERIEAAVGDGRRWGLRILYSPESRALETAGGIRNALDLISSPVFAVVNADVFSEYDYAGLAAAAESLCNGPVLAHLVLVDNPPQHPGGDFALQGERVRTEGRPMFTFSGLGAYRSELFAPLIAGEKRPLAPLLRAQMDLDRVSGEHFGGWWTDVGTPDRLRDLDDRLRRKDDS